MSNTLIPGAEISYEVKTDLHLWRPEFLRLPAGFRTPFQLTETRGFADHFLKISKSYSSGNLNYSNFPARGAKWSVMMSCTIGAKAFYVVFRISFFSLQEFLKKNQMKG